MVCGLLVAWILSWFNVDDVLIQGINEIFNTNFSVAVYYLIFAILGALSNIKIRSSKD